MRISDWSSDVCSSDLFTGRNVQGYRYRRSFPEAVHAVRVEYDNIDKDCRPDELVVFNDDQRSEEHTSELQSLMRISYAVFCLKKKIYTTFYLSYMIN